MSRLEAARERLIERYIIQAIDKRMSPAEIGSYLNERIRSGTGRLFDELTMNELLDQFGFPSYAAWQEQQQSSIKSKQFI